MRFFKTTTPGITIYAGASVVRWRSVDGITGYLSTEDPKAIAALENCIAKKIGGGISEIQAEEFTAWEGKVAGAPEFRPEREEISPGTTSDTLTQKSTSLPPTPAPAPAAEVAPPEKETPTIKKRKAATPPPGFSTP